MSRVFVDGKHMAARRDQLAEWDAAAKKNKSSREAEAAKSVAPKAPKKGKK